MNVSWYNFERKPVLIMKSKLTLSLDAEVKRKAQLLSRERKRSISALVSEFFERERVRQEQPLSEFWGIWADRDITVTKIRKKAWSGE
jgi:uncharacterized protein YdaU (DUF1376 family)